MAECLRETLYELFRKVTLCLRLFGNPIHVIIRVAYVAFSPGDD